MIQYGANLSIHRRYDHQSFYSDHNVDVSIDLRHMVCSFNLIKGKKGNTLQGRGRRESASLSLIIP